MVRNIQADNIVESNQSVDLTKSYEKPITTGWKINTNGNNNYSRVYYSITNQKYSRFESQRGMFARTVINISLP